MLKKEYMGIFAFHLFSYWVGVYKQEYTHLWMKYTYQTLYYTFLIPGCLSTSFHHIPKVLYWIEAAAIISSCI